MITMINKDWEFILIKNGTEQKKTVDSMDTEVTEFDNELFIMLVDRITVYSKDDVRVRFINGIELIA